MSINNATPRDVQYTVVDLSTDVTTVYPGPCIVVGASVQVALSAHACPVQDGSTSVLSLEASAPVGTYYNFGNCRFNTSLVVNPNDAATGTIAILYVPNHDGLAA